MNATPGDAPPARRGPPPGRTWLWLIAAAIFLSIGLGDVALLDPDEPRYAVAAREMVRTGDVVVPVFNGAPRLNKPPLTYWLQAGAFMVAGESELTARLPSALAALATLMLTAWFAARRLPPEAAPTAVALLATTPIFFAVAHLAIPDALLTWWCALTLIGWHEAVEAQDRRSRRAPAYAAALACGLAVLTKGPVGFLLPAAIMIGAAAVDRFVARGRATAPRRMITWRGVACGLAGITLVAGPWVAGLAGRIGMGPILSLVARETLTRAGGGLDHPRPAWYFLATFWPLFLPWSIPLPFAIARALRPAATGSGAGPAGEAARRRTERFLITWCAGTLVFFSAIADKNDAWILPAAPPVALLVASRFGHRGLRMAALVAALSIAAAVHFGKIPLSETRSLRGIAEAADLARTTPYDLIAYRVERPSLVWYSRRNVAWLRSGEDLARRLAEQPPDRPVAILMTEARRRRLSATQRDRIAGFDRIADRDGYLVFLGNP